MFMTVRRFPASVPALLTSLAVSAVLAACAPTQQAQQAPVTANTSVSRVSFYPDQAGLSWTYLPDGDT
jgi:hypothetical protein